MPWIAYVTHLHDEHLDWLRRRVSRPEPGPGPPGAGADRWPKTMVMNFDPDQRMHARYQVAHDFLDAPTGWETVTIGRVVNAFFRWEFNSCETLIKAGVVYPIDYANACPDIAITSLHYYFPWAIKALVSWSVFCTATGRRRTSDERL